MAQTLSTRMWFSMQRAIFTVRPAAEALPVWARCNRLTPSNGGWTESVLYSFAGGSDGSQPWGGVIFDQAGNLYGTTYEGGGGCNGFGCGTVFELTPSGSGWRTRKRPL